MNQFQNRVTVFSNCFLTDSPNFLALPYFDQALQRAPQDIRALLGRATYRAQACKYSDALKDLATAHAANPDNIYVLASECFVKYLCCEFEKAMVDNLAQIPFRKKPDNFVLGVMHVSIETIMIKCSYI